MFSLLFGAILQILGTQTVFSKHEINLGNRYPDAFVNEVMKKNILLAARYMGDSFIIEPGKTVSFHEFQLPKYETSRPLLLVHFTSREGFLSDGFIVGDGVCHLASLIAWVARDAGLVVDAPTNHDFRRIPQIPKEYGVSIYSNPRSKSRSEPQNLYITNTKNVAVEFQFKNEGELLELSAVVKNSDLLRQTRMRNLNL